MTAHLLPPAVTFSLPPPPGLSALVAVMSRLWFTLSMSSPLSGCPPGLYRGRVEGTESGACEARIEVRAIPGGCSSVDYEAVGADGPQHVEHTVVTAEALYVAHSEKPGVDVFLCAGDGVFEGPPGGPYAQRLVIGWDGLTLTWSWHWGPAGATPTEKSRALVRRVEG